MRNIYRPRFKNKGGVTRIIRDNYGKSWYTLVKEVLERDDHKCRHVENGRTCLSNKDLQVHHILPLSRGGKSEKSNLITLCEKHHTNRHPHMAKPT